MWPHRWFSSSRGNCQHGHGDIHPESRLRALLERHSGQLLPGRDSGGIAGGLRGLSARFSKIKKPAKRGASWRVKRRMSQGVAGCGIERLVSKGVFRGGLTPLRPKVRIVER